MSPHSSLVSWRNVLTNFYLSHTYSYTYLIQVFKSCAITGHGKERWEIHDNFKPFVATCRADSSSCALGKDFIFFAPFVQVVRGLVFIETDDGQKWPNGYVHCSHFVTGQLDKLIKYPGWPRTKMKIYRDRIRLPIRTPATADQFNKNTKEILCAYIHRWRDIRNLIEQIVVTGRLCIILPHIHVTLLFDCRHEDDARGWMSRFNSSC